MIADAIFWKVTNDTTVNGLIAGRFYPSYARQVNKVSPFCVYKFLKSAGGTTNQGPIDINGSVLQIAAIANTYDAAAELAAAIENLLDGARGTWQGVIVQGVFLKDSDAVDDEVVTEPDSEKILFHVKHISFDVRYIEP